MGDWSGTISMNRVPPAFWIVPSECWIVVGSANMDVCVRTRSLVYVFACVFVYLRECVCVCGPTSPCWSTQWWSGGWFLVSSLAVPAPDCSHSWSYKESDRGSRSEWAQYPYLTSTPHDLHHVTWVIKAFPAQNISMELQHDCRIRLLKNYHLYSNTPFLLYSNLSGI